MAQDLPQIGYIGVGLMGHGAAANILAKGYELTILGNRNRVPVEDLGTARRARGAIAQNRSRRHATRGIHLPAVER